jgi:hypothetical protein
MSLEIDGGQLGTVEANYLSFEMHGDRDMRTVEVKHLSLQIDGGHLMTEEATN